MAPEFLPKIRRLMFLRKSMRPREMPRGQATIMRAHFLLRTCWGLIYIHVPLLPQWLQAAKLPASILGSGHMILKS